MLFSSLRSISINDLWNTRYLLFCGLATLFSFMIITLFTLLVIKKNKTLRGEFIQGSFRGSAVLLAFAYIQNMYNNVSITSLMVLVTVPLYNLLSAFLLSLTDSQNNRLDASVVFQSLVNLFQNPIMIGIFIGILGSWLQPVFPKPIEKTIAGLASITSPLALICMGGSLVWTDAKNYAILTAAGTAYKLLIQPAIFLPVAVYLGFRGEALFAVLIMLGSPTSTTSYIMARKSNHSGSLTAFLVITTTLLSTFTLSFWIYVIRIGGLI